VRGGARLVVSAIASAPKEPVVDRKLGVVVGPASDVERSKDFCTALGRRLDADVATDESFRVVQVTPPGSPASVIVGTFVTNQPSGSAQGLHLSFSDPDGNGGLGIEP
jgi:hypothetical protein